MSQAIFVQPLAWEGAAPGKCRQNVSEMVRRHGGEPVFGWAASHDGPIERSGMKRPPLFRCWIQHVVWRDASGRLWEVSPSGAFDRPADLEFAGVDFLPDPLAEIGCEPEAEAQVHPARYEPLRQEGREIAECLNRALGTSDSRLRTDLLSRAFHALHEAGYAPRELQIESHGEQLVRVACVVE